MDFILYTYPEKTKSNIFKKINLCLGSLKCMALEAGQAVRGFISQQRQREQVRLGGRQRRAGGFGGIG